MLNYDSLKLLWHVAFAVLYPQNSKVSLAYGRRTVFWIVDGLLLLLCYNTIMATYNQRYSFVVYSTNDSPSTGWFLFVSA
jgi:hypothetical protein